MKKYLGLLLLLMGGLLLVVGVMLTGSNQVDDTVGVDDEMVTFGVTESSKPTTVKAGGELVINLPAPGSIVGSPLLVRGRVLGYGDRVNLRLLTVDGETVEEAITEVREEEVNDELVSFWQTSLVFDPPEAVQGWLEVKLIGRNDKILEEKKIPLLLRED